MINIINSDITKTKVDCIINPANGLGVMHQGVGKMLMREGGPDVQNTAKEICFKHGLYKPGEAYMGSSGLLIHKGIKSICHAVLIYRYPEKIKSENISKSIESSISLIKEYGYRSFSVPSLGISPRNIDAKTACGYMLEVLNKYKNEFDIYVIDINHEFINEFKKQTEENNARKT